MSFALGIGIVTYNRSRILSGTIDRVRALTRHHDTAFVVADDGSNDGTSAMLRDKGVPAISGVNMGIAWNKNRALFLLSHMLGCETVVLLEDDTQPNRPGWEIPWIQAARRWGHANLAGGWLSEHFLSGTGTAECPVRCEKVTAQCSAYSRAALTFGGYLDPRFTGYGHEHVEHSIRMIRAGCGGCEETIDGQRRTLFYLINGDFTLVDTPSYHAAEQVRQNLEVANQVMAQEHYRAPWGNHSQMLQFRAEVESAMSDGVERFRLTAPADRSATGGLLRSLLRRG